MAEREQGITAITVGGYKSIRDETTIKIRPLTILAGANSSGKSSIMQPMLLMKQTLEATYDPGPLLINGPHVKFNKHEQLLSWLKEKSQQILTIGFEYENDFSLTCEFVFPTDERGRQRQIELARMKVWSPYGVGNYELSSDLSSDDISSIVPGYKQDRVELALYPVGRENVDVSVASLRCFLHIMLFERTNEHRNLVYRFPIPNFDLVPLIQTSIEKLIHVREKRVDIERTYRFGPVQAPRFQGAFENYTASLILHWEEEENNKLDRVAEGLRRLRLTRWVEATRIDDAHVELEVGRLPVTACDNSRNDRVNIADVGSSVQLVLPVLVALAAAEPEQLAFIEQPESELHPRAQVALASVLADAAKRGVRVVIETHSSLLLQAVMTLIAEDKLDHEDVMLHWFSRDEEGFTKVDSVEPDENGAYGDWPEDFGDVELEIMGKYLNAVGERDAVPDNA